MSVTVREIAKAAGVSISTVSRVLNDHPCVDAETRKRVKAVIDANGYVPKLRTKPPEQKKSVCIVLSDSTGKSVHAHPTVYTILGGLTNRLTELGIGNSLHMLGDSPENIQALLSVKADAFIFIRTRREQEDIVIPKLLGMRGGVPVMAVNRRLEDKRVSYVNIDDYAAAFHATEYLIRLGHRRIGLINGDESLRNSILRRDGYLGAMKKHGLEIRPEWMIAGEYTEEFGKCAAKHIAELDEDMRPEAVFTTSDVLALGLQKALLKLGFRLPEQLSVIGFGDVELASYINPPLTTVRIPAREMGIQAANAVNYLIQSPSIQNIKIVMKSELCVRKSTCLSERRGKRA